MRITTSSRIFALVAAVAVALSGCSDDAAVSETAATTEQAVAPDATESGELDEFEGETPFADGGQAPGVSGRIGYVADGVMQVQDSSSQTAVSFSDDTEITQEVTARLADVLEGLCLTGTEEDGVLVSVALTEAVDGECTSGFGGFGDGESGGLPGGQMPEGMPTDLPTDLPSDLPDGASTDRPEGMERPDSDGEAPEGIELSGRVVGLVTGVQDTTISVETTGLDGSVENVDYSTDSATVFSATTTVDTSSIEVGLCVSARGEYEDDTLVASSLALSEPGDDGCTSALSGGFGGAPGGQLPGGDSEEGTNA